MKAEITQVCTESVDPKDFGWVSIKLVPETEEEKKMMAAIEKNHRRLCSEESPDTVAEIISISSAQGEEAVEIDISFPKSAVSVVA